MILASFGATDWMTAVTKVAQIVKQSTPLPPTTQEAVNKQINAALAANAAAAAQAAHNVLPPVVAPVPASSLSPTTLFVVAGVGLAAYVGWRATRKPSRA
jgi:hypothetical protein